MNQLPKDPKKIRQRLRRYERELRKEYETFGAIHDGSGKRYFLGPLYMLLDDLPGPAGAFGPKHTVLNTFLGFKPYVFV